MSQQLPRFGLFPGQRAALRQMMKKADKFDHFRQRTRRALLATVVASATACGAAFFGGWRAGQRAATAAEPPTEPPSDAPTEPQDALLALARGPLVHLEREALHLLRSLHGRAESDPVWLGYHRLMLVAAEQAADTPLRRLLLEAGDRDGAPLAAREAAERLRRARR